MAVITINLNLTTTNVTEGTNLYYTDARVRAAITGTSDRITFSVGGAIDIAATYVGQTSITTLGTVGTGVWQGSSISTTYTEAKIKGTIASTQIGYGSAADTLTGSANLIYDGTTITFTSDSGVLKLRSLVGSTSIPAIYGNQVTPSATNFGFSIGTGFTYINSTSLIQLGINGSEIGRFSGSSVFSLGSSGGAGSFNLGGVNNTVARKLNLYHNANSSFAGISLENNTNGTAATVNVNFFNESINHQSAIIRNASAATGNIAGTSIANSNIFYINNIHAGVSSSKLGFNSTSVFALIGTTATNYGYAVDADGFRVDQIQNLHTTNLNPFTVNGNSYFGGNVASTAKVHIAAGSATANTAPLQFTSGTVETAARGGVMEYNNTFHLTNSDNTRRHVVLAASSTKTTAGAPYTNDGYVVVNIGGVDVKVMTTA